MAGTPLAQRCSRRWAWSSVVAGGGRRDGSHPPGWSPPSSSCTPRSSRSVTPLGRGWRSAGAWWLAVRTVLASRGACAQAARPSRRLLWPAAGAGRSPAAPPPRSVLEPRPSPGPSLGDGQPRQLRDAPQEPAPRAHAAPPRDGPRSDGPCLERARVPLATGTYRSNAHPAERRTDGPATDSSSPGPTWEQHPSPSSYRDRKRGSSSAERSVRDQFLFSRTPNF